MRLRRRRTENGAAAVEFALVLPILLLIVFGILAYGAVFAQSLSLSNSARQAARSAVADYGDGATCASINNLAKDSATTIGMDGADTVVDVYMGADQDAAVLAGPLCGPGNDGEKPCTGSDLGSANIYVQVSYTAPSGSFTKILPLPTPTTLAGKGVYRCEFSASSTA
jgi:Flp pilus assembly protein TadG